MTSEINRNPVHLQYNTVIVESSATTFSFIPQRINDIKMPCYNECSEKIFVMIKSSRYNVNFPEIMYDLAIPNTPPHINIMHIYECSQPVSCSAEAHIVL